MRFKIARCEYQTDKTKTDGSYEGPVIVLAKGDGLCLFFPILEHTAKLLKYIFEVYSKDEEEKEKDEKELEYEFTEVEKQAHTQSIGIYQTMINLWRDNGLFLSGLVMDSNFSIDSEEDMIVVYMVLSNDENGFVYSVVRINFQHALVLAALLGMEINVNEVLLYKIIPSLFEDDDEDDEDGNDEPKKPSHQIPPILDQDDKFPVDSELLNIARDLLRGENKPQKKGRKKKE